MHFWQKNILYFFDSIQFALEDKQLKNYYLYKHPKYGQRIVEDGFSFLGMIFSVLWLAFKKLYIPALIFFFIFLTLNVSIKHNMNKKAEKIDKIMTMPDQEIANKEQFKRIYHRNLKPVEEYESEARKWELARSAYAQKATELRTVIITLLFFMVVACHLIIGYKGNAWLRFNLEKRGFSLIDEAQAQSKDQFIAYLYSKE